MSESYLSFIGELKDLLPDKGRQTSIAFKLNGPVAAKHAIEALGVPHTEVNQIVANGASVGFYYQLQPGDRLDIFPVSVPIVVMPIHDLRPPLPVPPRFVVDNHLGQLARHLRLLGFDTQYGEDDDEKLAQISFQEKRVLLTRDRRLLMRKLVVHGYCLRTREPEEQLQAVIGRFDLAEIISPWHRCLRCNGILQPVEKKSIIDRLEPKTRKHYHEFQMCGQCQQIYWKGSHYKPLREFVERIVAESERTNQHFRRHI